MGYGYLDSEFPTGIDEGWFESPGLLNDTNHSTSVGRVNINWSSYSKRLRYAIGSNVTYGEASHEYTLDQAKKEVEQLKDKLVGVKTMNQLLKVTILAKGMKEGLDVNEGLSNSKALDNANGFSLFETTLSDGSKAYSVVIMKGSVQKQEIECVDLKSAQTLFTSINQGFVKKLWWWA